MKSGRNWVVYGIYLLILAGYLAGSHLLLTYLNAQGQMKFEMRPYILVSTAVYVLFGILLGLDHLYQQFKSQGKWRINIGKLLLLGIPAAFLVLCRLVSFSVGANGILPAFIIELILSNDYIPIVSGALFGYTLISSFEKVTQKSEKEEASLPPS